jgi:hypothetical protein
MRHKEKQGKKVKRTKWHFLMQYFVQCPRCRVLALETVLFCLWFLCFMSKDRSLGTNSFLNKNMRYNPG